MASCLWFIKHYQTKENWKNNAMPIYKISSFLIWHNDSFPNIYIYYYAFIIQKCKNTRFLNEISSKNFKSLNGHIFNSYISISYTIKNICPRISLTTLVLKYICNFFKLCDKYYFVTNILHTFKLLDWILSQSNIQNKKKKSKMWCPYITKKNNYKKLY